MQNEELEIIRMSEIQMREVEWLWYPYIPFGKLTIFQGDPGEGKTTFALRLAAACSTGTAIGNIISVPSENGGNVQGVILYIEKHIESSATSQFDDLPFISE